MRYSSVNESDFAIAVNVAGFYIAMVGFYFFCKLIRNFYNFC